MNAGSEVVHPMAPESVSAVEKLFGDLTPLLLHRRLDGVGRLCIKVVSVEEGGGGRGGRVRSQCRVKGVGLWGRGGG